MTIQIPPTLRADLAKTTSYDIQLQNQMKKHENDTLHLMNRENQQLIELQRNNARELERLDAIKKRALMKREEEKVNREGVSTVEITNAEEKVAQLITKCTANKSIAENESKRDMIELVNKQATKSASTKIAIDKQSEIEQMKSKVALESTIAQCEAQMMEAEAEAEAIVGIRETRKQEVMLEKAKAVGDLAEKSKLMFTGDTGDQFLKNLLSNLTD